ncbi:MAG: secretin and TonB N-terminal domain-containing protein, partial [Sinobacterium sp.]|nr:secretin and TonB N-terminal domain-containing protein [Sinobacterium sp.]
MIIKNKKRVELLGANTMKGLKQLLFITACLVPSAVWAVSITDVEFNSLPGGQVEMTFEFDGQVPDPKIYTIESPARIALDLEGVSSSLKQKKHTLDLGNAKSVMVLESGGRTRVIVNLLELTKYETAVEGNKLVVRVGNDGVQDYLKESHSELADTLDANTISAVNSIDFRRGDKGEGRLLINLSNPNIDVDSRVEGESIFLSFSETAMPEKLQLRYDVSDFATPVQWVKATEKNGVAELEIRPQGEYDFLAYQAENSYVLTVKPLSKEDIEAKRKEFAYVGDRLSLNFQNIEVRAVLQLIADFTDLNLVASDSVNGRITLRLQNVPWDQALDIILKTKGLDKRQDGNVLLVAPAVEIAAREKQEIESNRQIEELAPLQTEFIRVRYAKATSIFDLLQGGGGGGSDDDGGGAQSSGKVLSSRASVIVDERTNSLLITETAAKQEEIRRLINLIDVPIRQVSIEARIVIA